MSVPVFPSVLRHSAFSLPVATPAGPRPTYLWISLVASVVGLGVAVLVWRNRDHPGAGPLAVFVVAASLWSMAEGLELAVVGLAPMQVLSEAALVLSAIIPVAWLVAVLGHTGRSDWVTRHRLAVLGLEPFVVSVLVVTSGSHDLLWATERTVTAGGGTAFVPAYGVAYWAHLAYVLGVVAAGGLVLFGRFLRRDGVYRWQAAVLLAAVALPTLAHAAFAFGLTPVGIDPTSLGYALASLLLSGAILQGRLLSLAPLTRDLGREAVLSEIDDRVLILDADGVVLDANRAAESLFGGSRESLAGRDLDAVCPALAETLADLEERDGASVETTIERDGQVRHYDVRVSTIRRARGAVSGTVVSLREITDRRQREQRLDVLNRLLRHNLRNELNLVRGNAGLLADHVPPDQQDRIEAIKRTVDSLVADSYKIGQAADALDAAVESGGPIELSRQLDVVVAEASEECPAATITLECPEELWIDAGPPVVIAIEELVENAVEHGSSEPNGAVPAYGSASARPDAPGDDQAGDPTGAVDSPREAVGTAETGESRVRGEADSRCREFRGDADGPTVEVSASVAGSRVRVAVTDDGPGIDRQERAVIEAGEESPLRHGSGVGLWLANWIVGKYGGTLEFETGNEGTTVTVGLPRADASGGTDGPEPAPTERAE